MPSAGAPRRTATCCRVCALPVRSSWRARWCSEVPGLEAGGGAREAGDGLGLSPSLSLFFALRIGSLLRILGSDGTHRAPAGHPHAEARRECGRGRLAPPPYPSPNVVIWSGGSSTRHAQLPDGDVLTRAGHVGACDQPGEGPDLQHDRELPADALEDHARPARAAAHRAAGVDGSAGPAAHAGVAAAWTCDDLLFWGSAYWRIVSGTPRPGTRRPSSGCRSSPPPSIPAWIRGRTSTRTASPAGWQPARWCSSSRPRTAC